ncbi:helix-turn-helix domain-containing protein [Streptomyces sp. NPDC006739]|uniref:helix-turn-helix domain-containing protein n=1 Tax=Streptomyces sp. NPDC006739 TaxID=3364763 RepID=UPI0036767F58
MERPQPTFQVAGAAIRTRRMQLGLTQAQLAQRARISRPYVTQLENGDRSDMRPPTYTRLRYALRIQTNDRQLLTPPEDQHGKDDHARHDGNPHPHPEDPG